MRQEYTERETDTQTDRNRPAGMTGTRTENEAGIHRERDRHTDRNRPAGMTGTRTENEAGIHREIDTQTETDQLEWSAVGFNAMFVHVLGQIATNVTRQTPTSHTHTQTVRVNV